MLQEYNHNGGVEYNRGRGHIIPENFEVEAQADMKLCYELDWKPKVKVLEWLSNFDKDV